jgi:hypothetical protein
MLKKRGELSNAPRNRRLRCSRLDTWLAGLPDDEGYSCQTFGKGFMPCWQRKKAAQ